MAEEKSHVGLEYHQCPVCGRTHHTGNVLLDKRLQKTLTRETVTGQSLCPKHAKLYTEGYVCLVEASGSPAEPVRTGTYAHVRASAWSEVFKSAMPRLDDGMHRPIVFVAVGVIAELQSRVGMAS